MQPDYTPYKRHFQTVLQTSPEEVREELLRLKMAPFASDPVATLDKGELMVVSMKPYGAARQEYPFGWVEREERPGLHRWYDGDRASSNFVREGDRLLAQLIGALSLHLRPRQVFSTYAYFYRAADARQLGSFGLDRIDSTEFHRRFLEIVQPSVVVCIGNGPQPSAFALYQRLFSVGTFTTQRCAPRVLLKHFRVPEGPLVVGLPHLSYVRVDSFRHNLLHLGSKKGSL